VRYPAKEGLAKDALEHCGKSRPGGAMRREGWLAIRGGKAAVIGCYLVARTAPQLYGKDRLAGFNSAR
jgi:hypothetical protein